MNKQNIKTMLFLNIRMIISNRAALLLLTICSALFLLLVTDLSNEAVNRSSIPVGVLDLDQSMLSKKLVDDMSGSESLYVIRDDEEKLEKQLEDEYIKAYFIVEKGYESKVRQGDSYGLISMYYLKENKGVSILTDIVAKYMIPDISFYTTYRLYETYKEQYEIHSEQEYREYIDEIQSKPEFKFAIHTQFDRQNGQKDEINVSNDLIYRQVIIGLLGMFIAFLVMFFLYGLRNSSHLVKRMRLASISAVIEHGSTVLAVILVFLPIDILLIPLLLKVTKAGGMRGIIMVLTGVILFTWVTTELFLMLSLLCKQEIVYQLSGSLLLLSTGALSLLTIIATFISDKIIKIAKITPNYWFITRFTDIITSRNSIDLWGTPNTILLIIGVIITTLRVCVDKVSQKVQ